MMMNRNFFLIIFFIILSVPVFAQQSPMNVIVNKCGNCHKSGGDAPFSLTTYQDVKKRISTIKSTVESGYMPPWKADNDYCGYSNDKSLTQEEKKLIIDWIAAGAKQETAGKQTAPNKT